MADTITKVWEGEWLDPESNAPMRGFVVEAWVMRDGKIAVWEAAFNSERADEQRCRAFAVGLPRTIAAPAAPREAHSDNRRQDHTGGHVARAFRRNAEALITPTSRVGACAVPACQNRAFAGPAIAADRH